MSFLDNLENTLKSLESREEGQETGDRERRERERRETLAAAPHAERLKSSPYTNELLRQATRIGYGMRTKVHLAWIGTTLRLEARDRKLELRPTAEGIQAVFFHDGQQLRNVPVDLEGSPEALAREWLEDGR